MPRLRTCGSPIDAAASAISGQTCCSSADAATSWWTVPAPISILPSFSRMPDRPGNARDVDQRLRLAQPQLHQRNQAVAAGDELAARRWPRASFASASSSDVARLYSNGVEITTAALR